jgi:hypothetical protein
MKTIESLKALHRWSRRSDFILGDCAHRLVRKAIVQLKAMALRNCDNQITLHAFRRNFAIRLRQSGVPDALTLYCLGNVNWLTVKGGIPLLSGDEPELLALAIDRYVEEL